MLFMSLTKTPEISLAASSTTTRFQHRREGPASWMHGWLAKARFGSFAVQLLQ